MVVNSFIFLLFFTFVFSIYYSPLVKRNVKIQNIWLLLTSYLFYGFADFRMIPLLLGSTVFFYLNGLWLKKYIKNEDWKNAYRITTFGVVIGICVLLYFKYLGFFTESFSVLLNTIGFHVSWSTLNIVLPIGVSFFTFKLIGYVVDIYRERISPITNFVEFATYIAFFPTILSGPIDRSYSFIPQLGKPRLFDYSTSVDGCRQILWGMFTKMCIADNLVILTDRVWGDLSNSCSVDILLVSLLYPLQMYADFDGYSNMAIGVGKLLGLNITRNFNHPFLARNIADYWKRWHMSLTSWITDYVFSPLNISFRKMGNYGLALAVIINMIVVGLWHGSNWTFVLFGLYHGLLFVPLIISGSFGNKRRLVPGPYGFPKFRDSFKMIITFLLVAFGLIVFRAPSLSMINVIFMELFGMSSNNIPLNNSLFNPIDLYKGVVFAGILLVTEWFCRNKHHNLEIKEGDVLSRNFLLRWSVYLLILLNIIIFKGESSEFIYFKF